MTSSLALGETESTAYRGDRGKIAYDHSQVTHDKTLVGLGSTFHHFYALFDPLHI